MNPISENRCSVRLNGACSCVWPSCGRLHLESAESLGSAPGGLDDDLLSLNSAGTANHHLSIVGRSNRQLAMLEKPLRHPRRFGRQFDVSIAFVHLLHLGQQFNRVSVWLIVHEAMMHAAQENEILESMSSLIVLSVVESRTTFALCPDMTNLAGDRSARMHDGRLAIRVSATIARKREQPLDCSF